MNEVAEAIAAVNRGLLTMNGDSASVSGQQTRLQPRLTDLTDLPEPGADMDRAIALEVFHLPAAVMKAWLWPLPEFSSDRGASMRVVQELMFDALRYGPRLGAHLLRAARALGYAEDAERFGIIPMLLTVLTPDEICKAALLTVREASAETRTSDTDRVHPAAPSAGADIFVLRRQRTQE